MPLRLACDHRADDDNQQDQRVKAQADEGEDSHELPEGLLGLKRRIKFVLLSLDQEITDTIRISVQVQRREDAGRKSEEYNMR